MIELAAQNLHCKDVKVCELSWILMRFAKPIVMLLLCEARPQGANEQEPKTNVH